MPALPRAEPAARGCHPSLGMELVPPPSPWQPQLSQSLRQLPPPAGDGLAIGPARHTAAQGRQPPWRLCPPRGVAPSPLPRFLGLVLTGRPVVPRYPPRRCPLGDQWLGPGRCPSSSMPSLSAGSCPPRTALHQPPGLNSPGDPAASRASRWAMAPALAVWLGKAPRARLS